MRDVTMARRALTAVTIAATLPYLTLKALWLTGHGTGATSAAGGAELLDTRHLVGDGVTALLEIAAVALALALTCGWGRRVPAVLILVPMWVGTGLLTPIAVGMPLGLAVQAVAGGSPVPTDNGLNNWVYLCVYGGFLVQAAGLFVLFPGYVRRRWPQLLRRHSAGTAVPAPRPVVLAAGVVAAGYAGALVLWAATGSRFAGPAGFDTIAQRTYLVGVALVVLAGVLAVAAPHRPARGRHVAAWTAARYVLAWTGTAVTVLAGPTGIALSNGGSPGTGYLLVSLVGTLAGLVLTGAAVRVVGRTGPRTTAAVTVPNGTLAGR
jgi:hypothetical protein